jgi:hypothetical protein
MVISFSVKIVHHFLSAVLFLVVNAQPQFPFFCPQHHTLAFHPAHHVKRQLRFAPKRHLQKVILDALFNRLSQLRLYLKIPVSRTQSSYALVRTLVVVIFHPLPYPLLRVLEASELRPAQKLQEYRLPEPLDFPQCHRMVRLRFDVVDVVLLHLRLKSARAPPRGVLPPVVRQHLLRRVVLRCSPPVHLQHILRCLAAEQIKTGYKA